ncbi:MAG: TonB-dependent receptor plug domain-containing protein, partial [Flavisolibacter sp.]
MNKPILFLYTCLISGLSAQAQQSELDTVTISSSLRNENVSSTGRNIIVIRGEQFVKQPVHSIDELLRYLPGIEVQQRAPMGSQSDIILRGGTFQQVLVILDGVRLNDPNTGHFNSYIPIAPSEIDRIEILKGAASAIYGSEAVGGVIYIVSKSFARKKQQEDEQLMAQASVGSFGMASANVGIFEKLKNTSVAGGILMNHAKGEQQRGIHGYLDNRTVSFSVSHDFNPDWKLSLRSSLDSRDFAAQNFYTTFLSDTANELVQTWWNQANLSYEKGNNNFSFSAGYKKLEDTYRFNPSSVANSSDSKLFQMLAFYSSSWKNKHPWTTGVQYLDRSIKSNDRGMHHVKEIAQFNTMNFHAGNFLVVSPGLRFDWIESRSIEVVPQVNVSMNKGPLQLRGSVGKTIRN